MPIRSYRYMRRKAWRKRVAKRRRIAKGRAGKVIQPVHYFTRSQYATNAITVTAGTDYFGASSFSLINLPDQTDFTSLYDQYKILKVKWTLLPKGNSMDIGNGVTVGQMGRVFTVLDYDDSSAPSSFNQMCQYQNMRKTSTAASHTRTIVPKYLREVSTGLGTTANEPATGWIDCTNNSVLHRGIKIGIQAPPNGSNVYDLLLTYTLAFKNVR